MSYTAPELFTERVIQQPLRSKVLRNPCAYCKNRVQMGGKVVCSGTIGRTWWACRDGKTQPTFELDERTIGDAT